MAYERTNKRTGEVKVAVLVYLDTALDARVARAAKHDGRKKSPFIVEVLRRKFKRGNVQRSTSNVQRSMKGKSCS